ncbi:MAG: RNA ligase family protein [Chthoniobacteraceae bacterium]
MNALHKFPKTPHLLWLSPHPARNDKVMALAEADEFLRTPITVEEKLDGANLGVSFDGGGRLQAQNRGNFLDDSLSGQWHGLRGWLARHETSLKDHLPAHAILFGEWCYAQHSIGYTMLPDWFVGFDVFDAKSGRFWSTVRRDAFLAQVGVASIRRITAGRFTSDEVRRMLSRSSAYYSGPLEGIYLRQEDEEWLIRRAKMVRPEFVQAIGEHWSHGPLHRNQVATSHVANR